MNIPEDLRNVALNGSFLRDYLSYSLEQKRYFIKTMAGEAWDAYLAWTRRSRANMPPVKCSIVTATSLNSLLIMGLTSRYEQARARVKHLKPAFGDISVFRVVTNFVGSFLSGYALTGDQMYLTKAIQWSEGVLDAAYHPETGLPYYHINMITGSPLAGNDGIVLSDSNAGLLEYRYLYELTGNRRYLDRLGALEQSMATLAKSRVKGLYGAKIQTETAHWIGGSSSLTYAGRDFYYTLLKAYVQSNGREHQYMDMYREALRAVERNQMITSSRTGLHYARDFNFKTDSYGCVMQHGSCYLGAMLGLGAKLDRAHNAAVQRQLFGCVGRKRPLDNGAPKSRQVYSVYQHCQWAKDITETCLQASLRTEIKLMPELFMFDSEDDATNSKSTRNGHMLSPQLAESYFVLYRKSHNEKYRYYAWQLARSIHMHCRVSSENDHCDGYSVLSDVNRNPASHSNRQPDDFLTGTLLYLYLIFSEDSVLPLDQWVFNASGHPLPVLKNPRDHSEPLLKKQRKK